MYGEFYEQENDAIIHSAAEQTRDWTWNYLLLAMLQLDGSQLSLLHVCKHFIDFLLISFLVLLGRSYFYLKL